MRSLTPSEARVIDSLLSANPASEADRWRLSKVPRTTFQTVRRRALRSGWIYERYLPAPAAVGSDQIAFDVLQPYSERQMEVVSILSADPATVVLWSGTESILAVRFLPTLQTGEDRTRTIPTDFLRRRWSVRCASEPESLPIYFDFEGAWRKRIDAGGSVSYPQGLPIPAAPLRRPADLANLLRRPFENHAELPAVLSFSTTLLPRRQRRVIEAGIAVRRIFLALDRVPPLSGRRVGSVVLVSGLLNPGAAISNVVRSLIERLEVSPFLAVGDGQRIVFCTLAPAMHLARPRSTSVIGELQRHLHNIETIREPVESITRFIDHRYDRLARRVRSCP